MKNRGIRYLGSLLLIGALSAPLALSAQDRDDRKDHDRDDHANNQRVYDRDHKDYHQWNADEDRNYRQWWGQTHNGKQYREYSRANRKDQENYWKWRHEHGDHDRDDHRDHGDKH